MYSSKDDLKKNLISSNDCVFLIFIWTVTIKTDSELIRIWLSGSVVICHRFSHSPGSLSLNTLVIFLKLSAKIRRSSLNKKKNTWLTSCDTVLLNAMVGRGWYNGWETRPCGKNAPVYSKRFTGFSGSGTGSAYFHVLETNRNNVWASQLLKGQNNGIFASDFSLITFPQAPDYLVCSHSFFFSRKFENLFATVVNNIVGKW